MRTHRFEFKKTRRIKVVTHTQAISVDLTKEEAAKLLLFMDDASFDEDVPDEDAKSDPVGCAMYDLKVALRRFVNEPA